MPAPRLWLPPRARDRHFDPGTARNDGVSQPALGRDVPYRLDRNGVPTADLEYRLVDYSYLGGEPPFGTWLRHETRCPHCGRWLSYVSKDEAATIYLDCRDHADWEKGPYSRS